MIKDSGIRNCSMCGYRMLSQDRKCFDCGARNEDWEVYMGISPPKGNGCLGVLLLLFIPLMFFFGCEEEENNNDVNTCLIEGTWDFAYELSGGYCAIFCDTPIDETPCTMAASEKDCQSIQFNDDGVYIGFEKEGGEITGQGAWSGGCEEGDTLTIVPQFDYTPDNIGTFLIETINSNSLVIIGQDNSAAYDLVMGFKKQ